MAVVSLLGLSQTDQNRIFEYTVLFEAIDKNSVQLIFISFGLL